MLPPRLHSRRRNPDESIRQTDGDASQARLSAVRKRYLNDPFIALLVPQPHLLPSRPPLINIGTYIRSEAIDELVVSWLQHNAASGSKVQIVSLGAGSDTRFWRLATGLLGGDLSRSIARYLELDFAENTSTKIRAIQVNKELNSVLGEAQISGASLVSDVYAIRDMDLRNSRHVLQDILIKSDEQPLGLLDTSLPTLVLCECVLCYMTQEQSDSLLKWFSDTFDQPAVIIYEMYGLNDSFGRVMKDNLRSRNVTLPGVDAYPTLDDQTRRYTNNGFPSAHALSLKTIRSQYIDPKELNRISRIEMLDELEELELVLHHYFVSWAFKNATDILRPWVLSRKVSTDSD
ncbi:hypothetical protein M422DRAFT_36283 [Sphaerobolus stellatus SS14]|uniref:Leucine carboxyl methyltransferase 1 n=1 Tax=Sphaerobolus stellatus (strain SS14) TaxID=990650 RepID=A0A0C9U9P0_SPHS4|nr:hypothetical protein M422DRAFT_36283 [Sphaerobolus stellatus SS14]